MTAQIIPFPRKIKSRVPDPYDIVRAFRPDGIPLRRGDRVRLTMVNGRSREGIIASTGGVLAGMQTYCVLTDDGRNTIVSARNLTYAGTARAAEGGAA